MTYRAELSGRALKQTHGLPGPAFNSLIEVMAEVIDYPDDPLRTFPTSDPYVRRVEFGDAGLITYLINDDAGVVIVLPGDPAGTGPGSGARKPPHTLLVAVEELAYGDASIAWAAVPAFQMATILGACGTAGERQAAREVFSCDAAATASVLLYEDFGRQPTELQTRITSTEGGLDGHRSQILRGPPPRRRHLAARRARRR